MHAFRYDVIMETEDQLSHPVLGPLFRAVLQGVSKELVPEESVFPLTRMPGDANSIMAASILLLIFRSPMCCTEIGPDA
jgi:hypothetical protein